MRSWSVYRAGLAFIFHVSCLSFCLETSMSLRFDLCPLVSILCSHFKSDAVEVPPFPVECSFNLSAPAMASCFLLMTAEISTSLYTVVLRTLLSQNSSLKRLNCPGRAKILFGLRCAGRHGSVQEDAGSAVGRDLRAQKGKL